MDHKMLLPYPVDLFRLMDFDVIDQLIEHPGGQNLGSCVFTDGGDKHIRRYRLAAELVHFSTEGLDLLGYENTVFEVISLKLKSQTENGISFSVCVSKGGIVQEPDRTIFLEFVNGHWEVVNEGY
jgi:hypothetical protein